LADNEKRRDNALVSQVVMKIIVSLLFGGVAFVMAQGLQARNNVEIIVGVGVSIFVGGVAFVIQFLIDVAKRVDRLDGGIGKMGDSYREELARVSKATELFGLVEASALKTDAVTQLVRHASMIPQGTPPLVFAFAQAEMIRLSNYLRDIGQNADVTYDGEDRDWLLGLTRAATVSIDATSLTTVDAGGRGFVDGGLWTSDLGHRYLEAQQDAVARGVVIRRIFILDREDLRGHPELTEVINDHIAIGVDVRTLDPSAISRIRQALLLDFIVFDNVLVYQSSTVHATSNQRPRIVSTRLVTNPDRVVKEGDRYKELWEVASPYPAQPELNHGERRPMPETVDQMNA
jgi:hypothetical protein